MQDCVLISMAGRIGNVGDAGRDISQALAYSGMPSDFALPRQHWRQAGVRYTAAA